MYAFLTPPLSLLPLYLQHLKLKIPPQIPHFPLFYFFHIRETIQTRVKPRYILDQYSLTKAGTLIWFLMHCRPSPIEQKYNMCQRVYKRLHIRPWLYSDHCLSSHDLRQDIRNCMRGEGEVECVQHWLRSHRCQVYIRGTPRVASWFQNTTLWYHHPVQALHAGMQLSLLFTWMQKNVFGVNSIL